MDSIVLEAYKKLLSAGEISKETIKKHIVQGRITSEDYRNITDEDCDLPKEVLKQNKIKEIKLECQNRIHDGFYSNVKYGTMNRYTLKDYEQGNIQALIISIMGGAITVPWRHNGVVVCDIWTAEEFMQFYQQAMTFTINLRYKSDIIELYIIENEGITTEELNNINLDFDLPEDYQNILLDKLNEAGIPLWVEVGG
jgi:hypothetical protein